MKALFLSQFVVLLVFGGFLHSQAANPYNYTFVIQEASYTKLCSNKTILTVNGTFPGPTINLTQGDTTYVHVYNHGKENITIHWHGILQPRNPWSDGPEFVTQCPIMPNGSFIQKIETSDEIGTLWWHAHSDWSRATVHGALIVYPKSGVEYPFPKPDAEFPIILGEWWKSDIQEVLSEFLRKGGDPNNSDAFLINGQPGDLYNCSSRPDTFKLNVTSGKTYLFRMINAVMNNIMFFGIANHSLTIVGSDGSYTKNLSSDYIAISPGQTIDFLLKANQPRNHYYMAAKVYNNATAVPFDNTTTTAIIEYTGNDTPSSPPVFPKLPLFNDRNASMNFTGSLKSLDPVNLPKDVDVHLKFTLSINTIPCEPNNTCDGPRDDIGRGTRLKASVNNQSFVSTRIDLLQAYYYNNISGVYEPDFPSFPPYTFNFTADNLDRELRFPNLTTKVFVLEYNTTVELVYQGTNLVAGIDHPMHLHGHSFYVVGSGIGNFDNVTDPLHYNYDDPPFMNTIAVPKNGWTAVRFTANNPGVWLMHCHFERHISWGMQMTFIVKDGNGTGQQILAPFTEMPPC